MLAGSIGFFVWGSMLQRQVKYKPQEETLTKRQKTAPQKSAETNTPEQKTSQSPVAMGRQNRMKEPARRFADAAYDMRRVSHMSFRLVNDTEKPSTEPFPLAAYPVLATTPTPDDFGVAISEPPPEGDRIVLFALNPSFQSRGGNGLGSPISQIQPTGLTSMLMTMTTPMPGEYVSRIAGSGGAARRQPAGSGTGGPGGGRSGSRSGVVSDDHGNSRETGTQISIGDSEDGLMDRRGDRDYFVFNAKKGETISLDINARDIGSRIDSYIRLYDPDGGFVASNDDYDGLDSYLKVTVSKDGKYALEVRDLGYRGGPQYYYELSTWKD